VFYSAKVVIKLTRCIAKSSGKICSFKIGRLESSFIYARRNAGRRLVLMGFESTEQKQPNIELALFDIFELSPEA